MSSYYADKLPALRRVFAGEAVSVASGVLTVGARQYPILDDVIILVPPQERTALVRSRLADATPSNHADPDSEQTQFTFGAEWRSYGQILPEHSAEFEQYFDLVDRGRLSGAVICDLGCGMGRWSFLLRDQCRQLILVDFSDAIFVARRNLAASNNSLFFMADIAHLPFADDFCDFLFCLGVLHHLPAPCLEATRRLRRFAPELLIYLYYALDNRPGYYRFLLHFVSLLRVRLARIRSAAFRKVFAMLVTRLVYAPLVLLGRLFGRVPLHEYYRDKSLARIEQDVYDRFFTPIEQRVSRVEIEGLRDTFGEVRISDGLPYWHFLCIRS